jgi:hypothetical protein
MTDDEADTNVDIGEIAHWIAGPMSKVGTFEQFHDVVHRAETVIKLLRAGEGLDTLLKRADEALAYIEAPEWTDEELARADVHEGGKLIRRGATSPPHRHMDAGQAEQLDDHVDHDHRQQDHQQDPDNGKERLPDRD